MKIIKFFISISTYVFFLSFCTILLLSCSELDKAAGIKDSSSIKSTYAIGDIGPSGVGTVIYISNGGLHGLEAAPSMWYGLGIDPKVSWIIEAGYVSTFVGTQTGNGTGLANSNAIIALSGHITSAAKLCRDYRGGGKTDWFLPSYDELSFLYAQRNIVEGLNPGDYWSSSESSTYYAWYLSFSLFSNGEYNNESKGNTNYVRPIRSF